VGWHRAYTFRLHHTPHHRVPRKIKHTLPS
jgi:hypothetical protein